MRIPTLAALMASGLWLCDVAGAQGLSPEQLAALRESVREMCLLPDRAGDYLKVEGEAKAGLPVNIKLVKANIAGKVSYDTWKGIPITLDKYKVDPRQCALEMTKLLLPSLTSPPAAQGKPANP